MENVTFSCHFWVGQTSLKELQWFPPTFLVVRNVAMMNASHSAFVAPSPFLSLTLSMSTGWRASQVGKTGINQALSAVGAITLEGLWHQRWLVCRLTDWDKSMLNFKKSTSLIISSFQGANICSRITCFADSKLHAPSKIIGDLNGFYLHTGNIQTQAELWPFEKHWVWI